VRPRTPNEMFAYVIPPEGPGRVLDILERGGVEIDFPGRFMLNQKMMAQGTAVIRLAQPYAGFRPSAAHSSALSRLARFSGTADSALRCHGSRAFLANERQGDSGVKTLLP
jgi:hypothetical protein